VPPARRSSLVIVADLAGFDVTARAEDAGELAGFFE
jgi:hypothetical protein